MSWKDIVKADPCTLEAKERFYRVLEEMGANSDLLNSFKDLSSDELREMIEEFSTTAMESQRPMFKQMLRDWDVCLVQENRNPNASPDSGDHSQHSMMYKGQSLVHNTLKEAIVNVADETKDTNNRVYAGYDFLVAISQKYKEFLMRDFNDPEKKIFNTTNNIIQHVKHKAAVDRLPTIVGRVMVNLGYKKQISYSARNREVFWSK